MDIFFQRRILWLLTLIGFPMGATFRWLSQLYFIILKG